MNTLFRSFLLVITAFSANLWASPRDNPDQPLESLCPTVIFHLYDFEEAIMAEEIKNRFGIGGHILNLEFITQKPCALVHHSRCDPGRTCISLFGMILKPHKLPTSPHRKSEVYYRRARFSV